VPLRWHTNLSGAKFTCMVSILQDGTIQASHGGIEIGQGIDTKVAQTIAYKLGCSMSLINIMASVTTSTPEVGGTGASITSESCCSSAIDACDKLNAILSSVKQKLQDPTWNQLITEAYKEGLHLQVLGFVPKPTVSGGKYDSYSAVVQEVFVDILTGEHQLLRTDILFDAGISLNPAIDIGQVEGAYVMGVGLFCNEEQTYDPNTGELLNNNTWNYKPPSYADIPIDFRVNLLKNAPNPAGILSSKLVGEPPLSLSCATILGIQQAVMAAKKAAGQDTKNFGLNAPAVPENVLPQTGVYPVAFKPKTGTS